MSQRTKNGNITNFFKPMPKIKKVALLPARRISEEILSTPSSSSLSPPPPSSSPLSDPGPSSPAKTHAPPPTPTPTRDLEIPASDDEDDLGSESDASSLDDLTAILGQGRSVKPNGSPAKKLLATPSRRSAIAFHASPLTLLPKQNANFKALMRSAKKDTATKQSSTVAKADSNHESLSPSEVPNPDGKIEGPKGDQKTLRYCFFKDDFISPPSKPYPKRLRGHWRLLSQANKKTRQRYFEDGIPRLILKRVKKLPDELFEWVLDELCVNNSLIFRRQGVTLITQCPEQMRRLVTPQRLEGLFTRLGVSADLDDKGSELPAAELDAEPYEGRVWGHVESFLSLLGRLALHMAPPSVLFACHALMRMSLDTVICDKFELFRAFQDAIQPLLHAVPRSSWADFVSGRGDTA